MAKKSTNNPFRQAAAETRSLDDKLRKNLSAPLYSAVNLYIKEEVQREKERLQKRFENEFLTRTLTLSQTLNDEKASTHEKQAAMKEYVEIVSPVRVKKFVDEQIHIRELIDTYNKFLW